MGFTEAVVFLLPTIGISSGAAVWLSKKLIEHRLKKDLEVMKTELKASLDQQKAMWEGMVRQEVETVLGNRAANREYELDARKRLYLAIGPVRFQLLLACRDLAGRVSAYGLREHYETDPTTYYGQSTLFRILRPLTLGELAERQIAYADFAIDPAAIELLKFRKNAFAVLSGGSLVEGHSKVNWEAEAQHVFFDHLSRAANALVVKDDTRQERCMRFHEFGDMFGSQEGIEALSPFTAILKDFTPEKKPLFWLRLVAYGYLCNDHINRNGCAIGFEVREFEVEKLITISKDPEIAKQMPDFVNRCKALPKSPL